MRFSNLLVVVMISIMVVTSYVAIGAQNDDTPMELLVGNQAPNITGVELTDATPGDDSMILWPNTTQKIYCWGHVFDVDSYGDLTNAYARIWDEGNYNYDDPQNNKFQYRNNSCTYSPVTGSSYGANALVNCTFDVWYYANYSDWNCTITINDTEGHLVNGSGNSTMEQLVAVDITNSSLNWSNVAVDTDYDPYVEFAVENEGNVRLDLELDAYNNTDTGISDDYAFGCQVGSIGVDRISYNLTGAGVYSESSFLSAAGVVLAGEFDLMPQDGSLDTPTIKSGFLGINVPSEPMINGTCTGFLRVNGINDEP